MNKRKIALIIIILLIICGLIIFKVNQSNQKKEYEIQEISEYKYFLLYDNNKMGVIDTKVKIVKFRVLKYLFIAKERSWDSNFF